MYTGSYNDVRQMQTADGVTPVSLNSASASLNSAPVSLNNVPVFNS